MIPSLGQLERVPRRRPNGWTEPGLSWLGGLGTGATNGGGASLCELQPEELVDELKGDARPDRPVELQRRFQTTKR